MFQFKIFKILNQLFVYPREGGASAEAIAVAGDNTGFVPSGDNIEKEFLDHMMANDEEFQEILGEEEKGGGGEKGGESENPGSKDGEGEGEEAGDGDGGDPEANKGAQDDTLPPAEAQDGDNWLDEKDNEYTFKDGKWVDESGEAFNVAATGTEGDEEVEDDTEYEYPDDVIPGLKGKDFAALSKPAQEAVAKYHQDTLTYQNDSKTDIEIMKIIKNDPIARHRLDLIRAGRANQEHELPTVAVDEVKKILDTETHDEAVKLINKAAQRIASVARDNERIRIDRQTKIKEANSAGEKILLEAGNLHPDLFNKKQDVDNRIQSFDHSEETGHADKKIYDEYHSKIVGFCTKRGYKYTDIIKMRANELYALVAVNEGWPVAFNTAKRDKKMLTEQTMKALEHFKRSKRGKEVARGMRTANNESGARASTNPFKVDGIDVVKLARDDGYHEGVLQMKPGKTEWIDRVRELRDKGEKIIDRRKRKREQAEKRGS